jgi:hypothetical protein
MSHQWLFAGLPPGGNRSMKAQNYPSDYSSEHASAALQQGSSSNDEWWKFAEMASVNKDNDENDFKATDKLYAFMEH